MKKWLIISIIFAAIIGLPYLLIPNNIPVYRTVSIHVRQNALVRSLTNDKTWIKWWPTDSKDNAIKKNLFNGNYYALNDLLTNSLIIGIDINGHTVKSSLDIVSVSNDSTILNWSTVIPTSYNPIERIQILLNANKLEQDFTVLLKKMQSYFSVSPNLYNITIKEVQVTDSTLIFISDSKKGYPSTSYIYSLIDQLKNYTSLNGALQTNPPMLNIYTEDGIIYQTKVALPVNKKLKDSGPFKYKWMLGGGKILTSDVIGGIYKIEQATQQIEYYIKDYNRVAPAIPFMSLTTDRSKEADTSKWITRIYYPVM